MDIRSLKRDANRIEAGEWVGDIPHMGDLRLKVRGLGSETYASFISRKIRALPRDKRERDGSATPAAMKVITAEAIHETILIDWDGLTDNDQPVPYDVDLAKTWLTSPDYAEFLDAVVWAARVVDNGKAEVEGGLEKN